MSKITTDTLCVLKRAQEAPMSRFLRDACVLQAKLVDDIEAARQNFTQTVWRLREKHNGELARRRAQMEAERAAAALEYNKALKEFKRCR